MITDLQSTRSLSNLFKFITTFCVGFAVTVGIQLLQFGVIYPLVFDFSSKKVVETDKCNCQCFDTWFKGYYEYWPGRYHHVYFNTTFQTGCIWAVTIFYVLAVYECIRKIISSIWAGTFRGIYCLLFAVGLYSHQYTWWSYFGYFNDDFYDQMFHQTLFSLTEIYASLCVLWLATTNSPLSFRDGCLYTKELDKEISRLSMLASISLAHLAVGSLDQFIEQNVFGIGHISQQSRNAGFILPDALGVLIPIRDLFILLPYILDLDGPRSTSHSGSHASMLKTSVKMVSEMFYSPHFHHAVIVFFVVVFFGTVL